MLRLHTGERPFTCHDCGSSFGYKSHLKTHLRKHFLTQIHPNWPTRTAAKMSKFECNHCAKSFTTKISIKKHLARNICTKRAGQSRQRRKEKIACSVCGKAVARYSLDKHLNTHTRARTYPCRAPNASCGRVFLEAHHRHVHERIHSGEKPYKCDKCGKTFRQAGNLKMHIRRLHRVAAVAVQTENESNVSETAGNKSADEILDNAHTTSSTELIQDDPNPAGDQNIIEFLNMAEKWIADNDPQLENTVDNQKKEQINFTSEMSYSSTVKEVKDSLWNKLMEDIGENRQVQGLLAQLAQLQDKTISLVNRLDPLPGNSVVERRGETLRWRCWDQKCHSFFSSRHLLVRHRLQHAHPHRCDLCGKTFTQLGNLRHHTAAFHTQEHSLRCEKCGAGFHHKPHLRTHVLRHLNAPPSASPPASKQTDRLRFLCDKCDKRFRDRTQLKRHLATHDVERHFLCPVPACQLQLKTSETLMRHIRRKHATFQHTNNTNAATSWALAFRGVSYSYKNILANRKYSTIYALSSGAGKCGVAVIRVSGSDASQAVLRLTKRSKLPVARRASVSRIIHPITFQHIDTAILLWLPGPGSATGEDTCELHVHGGPAVVSAVLSALSILPSFRPAEPGEFTRRAFLSGRMDLTQVEGLADLVNAETEQQRRQALLQMEGRQGTLYRKWRSQLIKCVAHLEAYIDLSEEENIEEDVLEGVRKELKELKDEMGEHVKDGRRGELLKNGVRTVILGRPNVGKSSLLNLLVGRSAAIVGPVAGTTRDVIEVAVDVGGYPMVLADTAGQRRQRGETSDPVEQEGMRRAQHWASSADLVLLLLDGSQMTEWGNWESYVREAGRDLGIVEDANPTVLPVINKCDLLSESALQEAKRHYHNAIFISCYTQEGMKSLITALAGKLQHLCGCPVRESPWVTQERHRQHVIHCQEELDQCLHCLNMQPADQQLTFAAHHARKAIAQMGNITGHVTTDHILDVVFKDFCVGK